LDKNCEHERPKHKFVKFPHKIFPKIFIVIPQIKATKHGISCQTEAFQKEHQKFDFCFEAFMAKLDFQKTHQEDKLSEPESNELQ
jgi:hypothetical protein